MLENGKYNKVYTIENNMYSLQMYLYIYIVLPLSMTKHDLSPLIYLINKLSLFPQQPHAQKPSKSQPLILL